MALNFYVTIDELKKGGRECAITYEKPEVPYVEVCHDDTYAAYRGANFVLYKGEELASELRNGPVGSDWEHEDRNPSIGLLEDALEKAQELGIC